MKHFTVEDGLPSNTVYDIRQDKNGIIWFSTDHGVCQYDGKSFVRYTTVDGLPDNEVFRMVYDSKERIWFVTQNGIPGFYHSGQFYVPSSDLTEGERGIMSRYQEDADGTIWMAWSNLDHVCLSSSGELTEPKTKNGELIQNARIYNSLVDTSNHIWLVLYPSSDERPSYELLDVSSGSKYRFSSQRSQVSKGLQFDSNNHIIQRTPYSIRRYRIDENRKVVTLIDSFSYSSGIIIAVNESNDKQYFLLACSDGAVEVSKENFKLQSQLIEGVSVSQVRQDNEGNHWITTLNDGVYFKASNSYSYYTEKDGLASNKLNVVKRAPSGEIWVGSQPNNLSIIHGDGVSTVQLPYKEDARAMIKDIDFMDDGTVLITGDQGIYEVKDDKLLRSSPIPAIDFNWAENGKIYITTRSEHILELDSSDYDQLFHSNLSEFRIHKGKKKSIKTILQYPDQLIHGSYDKIQQLDLAQKENKNLSASKQNILDFSWTQSGIWASTNGGGILQIQEGEVIRYTVRDGLLSNSCQTILCRNDSVFVGSNQGLSILIPQKDRYQIKNFQAPAYFSSNQIYDLHLHEKELLIATANGLSIFQLERLNEEPERLPFSITSVRVNGQQMPLKDGDELSSDQNNISIQLYAQNYQNAAGITYRYRLGPEQDWISTEKGEIILSSLSAGSYQLEAQAVYNGNPIQQSVELQFYILSPFWKRTSFLFFAVISVFIIMALLFYLRIRFVRKREAEKRRILEANKKALRSQMNPHFIFNSLNSIQHFILSNDARMANKYLSKFSTLIRNVLAFSDRESIYLFEEIALLKDYLDLEKFRLKDKFDYRIEVSPELNINSCKLPSLVIQPIVENAVWHGVANIERKGDIHLRFYSEGKMLKCAVSDNGEGKKSVTNKAVNHVSVGLTKTQERIKLWNERSEYAIEFIDRKEQFNEYGTLVIISLPLISEP